MKIFLIIFLLLLGIVFYPIFKVWMAMKRAQRRFQDAYRDASSRDRQGQATSGSSNRSPRRPRPDAGEYADFEDVSATTEPEQTPPAANQQKGGDSLVEEVEFEEIQ